MNIDPLWLSYARTQLGVAEIPGLNNNPTIMAWIKALGAKILGAVIENDDTPWCGTFAAHVVAKVGLKPPAIAARASSWDNFGIPIMPTLGAILRFQREGGGHVGFYVAEDTTHFHVLGGNQGNAVSIVLIDKKRLVASRWPTLEPVTTLPVIVEASGQASLDEA